MCVPPGRLDASDRAIGKPLGLPRHGLLGIELDDQLLVDLEVDVGSLRHSHDLGGQILVVRVDPLGLVDLRHFLSKGLELGALAALLLDSDHVAGLDEQRGDVDLLAVEGEVSMQNQLTSFLAAGCQTHSVHHVVQSSLKKV